MTVKFWAARSTGILIVFFLMVAAITGFYSVKQNAQAVRMSSNENILWAAFQIEVELLRFLETLATYETGTELNPEYVNHRFDILWSRLAVFQSGTVGQRLLHYDRDKQVISQMAETMRKTESLVVGLSSGDPSVALEIAAEFQAFPIPLRLLSRDVMHGEVKAEAGVRKTLATSVMVLLILSSAAVVASLALLAIFWRDSVRFRQIALQNEELLHTATMANKSKEKFLTMMSHELRTPMNGVLGPLALLAQSPISNAQLGLVQQSERSGWQMNALLTDILDFSALQTDTLELDINPFAPAQIVSDISHMFTARAKEENIIFQATLAPDTPEFVMGDFNRMRQALNHLINYLFDTAGTSSISVLIGYDDGFLKGTTRYIYGDQSDGPASDQMLNLPGKPGDVIASDALGPALARGIVHKMGGRTHLVTSVDGEVIVDASVPVEAVHETIEIAQRTSPAARLISVGKSDYADIYQSQLEMPISVQNLLKSVIGKTT